MLKVWWLPFFGTQCSYFDVKRTFWSFFKLHVIEHWYIRLYFWSSRTSSIVQTSDIVFNAQLCLSLGRSRIFSTILTDVENTI